MIPDNQQDKRLAELLADRAVFGLAAEDAKELQEIMPEYEQDVSAYDTLTALLVLSDLRDAEPPPKQLIAAVKETGRRMVEADHRVSSAATEKPRLVSAESAPPINVNRPAAGPWFVVAALVVVAVIGWLRDPEQAVSPPVTVAEQRLQLIRDEDDTVTVAWGLGEDPSAKGAEGDVVWSNARQSGFMRISGLAVNDPTVEQYQLWIIDRKRDPAQPVDGGVFDIPPGVDEVIIPVDAKLAVYDAGVFAITIERPGGVVVSDRKRLPLLAVVEEG